MVCMTSLQNCKSKVVYTLEKQSLRNRSHSCRKDRKIKIFRKGFGTHSCNGQVVIKLGYYSEVKDMREKKGSFEKNNDFSLLERFC